MTFELASSGGNCISCEWIYAKGEIRSGTHLKFYEFMHEYEATYPLVIINSSGGSLSGAINLGRAFRHFNAQLSVGENVYAENGHSDVVQGKCLDSCIVALLGGYSIDLNVKNDVTKRFDIAKNLLGSLNKKDENAIMDLMAYLREAEISNNIITSFFEGKIVSLRGVEDFVVGKKRISDTLWKLVKTDYNSKAPNAVDNAGISRAMLLCEKNKIKLYLPLDSLSEGYKVFNSKAKSICFDVDYEKIINQKDLTYIDYPSIDGIKNRKSLVAIIKDVEIVGHMVTINCGVSDLSWHLPKDTPSYVRDFKKNCR